jgi:hypothetical protein
MRVLLDAVRKSTEDKHNQLRTPLATPKVLKWMGTLDSVTLSEYRKALSEPPKMTEWGSPWGSVADMFIEAGTNDLDDMQTSLVLFVSEIITPAMKSWAVRGGTATVPAYDESAEYVTGLYDMLQYRPEYLPAEFHEALLISNVYQAQPETRAALAALITVTHSLVRADMSSSLITNESYHDDPPHAPYTSMNGRGSVWLGDGELIQHVLENTADAGLIAEVIIERKTGDLGTIVAVLGHEVAAVSSGVL